MSRPTLVSFDQRGDNVSDVLIPADFSRGEARPRQLATPGHPVAGAHDGEAVNVPYGDGISEFGTFTWDSQTNEVSMDSAMARLLGNPSPLIGARLKDFMDEIVTADRERLASTLRASLQSGQGFREELCFGDAENEPLKVRIIGKVVTDFAGQPKTIVGAVHPLTPLVAKELDADEPAERSMAQVCHDLRSPIGAILGYAQLLLNDSLPTQTRSYIEKINKNCEQLLETINESLNASRKGAQSRSLDNFSAAELLNDVGEMFEVAGISPQIQFAYSDVDAWTRVTSDRLKVRRILINLVDNALKFTARGQVSVSGHVTRDANAAPFLLLTVTDTGVGLDGRQIKRVFDPFYQNKTGGTGEGVGLGLSICHNLTRTLGAELSVTSEPGEGSCFTLRVPVKVVETTDAETPAVSAPPLAALLVGAESNHNRTIVDALSAHGCDVRWTDRADALGSDQPVTNVALVDCSHETTAVAQIESIHRRSPAVAIVAICDRISESHGQRLLDAGASTLLIKPFMESELITTLSQATPNEATIKDSGEVPGALADPMCEAARQADLDGLNGLIDDLEAIDRELAQDFKAMADRMDYDSVLDILSRDKPGH